MGVPHRRLVESEWPKKLRFKYGEAVWRRDMPDGRPPAYRFPGKICGWYVTPEGKVGYSVSRDGDPGCIQNFAEHLLEPRYTAEEIAAREAVWSIDNETE